MNEQQNTREAAINEAARSLSRLSSLGGRKKLLETLFDAGVVAGAASVDREAIVREAFEEAKKRILADYESNGHVEETDVCGIMDAVLAEYKEEGNE